MSEQESTRPQRSFFDELQWATIEAAMARIIPSDDTPGAREAGAIHFLDRYLSGLDYIYAKPDGSGFLTLHGKKADAWRQQIEILRQRYVSGIQEMNKRSRDRFAAEFRHLTPQQQDHVLADMEKSEGAVEARDEQITQGPVTSTATPAAMQQYLPETELNFFQLLVLHTRQGFYADPIYGGNRNHVGWQLIGFAGPASMAEAHAGRSSTLPFFANGDRVAGEGSNT